MHVTSLAQELPGRVCNRHPAHYLPSAMLVLGCRAAAAGEMNRPVIADRQPDARLRTVWVTLVRREPDTVRAVTNRPVRALQQTLRAMSRSSFLGLGPPPVVGGFTRRPDRESLRPGEEVSFEPVGHRGRPGVVRARGKSGPDPASTLTRAQRWEPLREPKVASVNLEAIHDNDDHLADVADVAGEYTVEADRQDWLAAARHQARSHSDDVTSVPHEEARHRLGVDSTA